MGMQEVSGIKVWGDPVDKSALSQIINCAKEATDVAMMADHHKGYAVPIGGVVAYTDKVSPSGVGYDIGCIAEGTPVTTLDGYFLPIETVTPTHKLAGWDGDTVREIVPNLGSIERGTKPVLRLSLGNGRTLDCTADHRIRTLEGWKEAGTLAVGEKVACSVFVGLPFVPIAEAALQNLPALPRQFMVEQLPALIRLLGVICGDGHLARNANRISIYTTVEEDAVRLCEDFVALGYTPSITRRSRKEGYRDEIQVYVTSAQLHHCLKTLGAPVGKKVWSENPMPYLFTMPDWLRAQFLSAFFSAECMTARLQDGGILNLQVKQAGENDNALRFIGALLQSLGFTFSIAKSGQERGVRQDYVLQILGGSAAQIRYCEQIGFCYALEKRIAAAQVASVYWQASVRRQQRELARQEAQTLFGRGVRYTDIKVAVSTQFGVSDGFVHHAIYDKRGILRPETGRLFLPETCGEVAFVTIEKIEPLKESAVFDIVTADPAHCFLANGIVVHNCGNLAVRLDVPAREVKRKIKKLMDEISGKLSFGMGRNNQEEVDHELFDDETWKLNAVKNLKQTARNQLGTIGGGNHYVDLFIDEQERVWVGVHFGSRGLGHKTATHFLEVGGAQNGMDADPLVLDVRSSLGQEYLACMELAGKYAYAGREWVCGKVARIIGAKIVEEVHNHHNFAWKEVHNGQELYVVRKGATPAFPGQKGFVGGSMGDISVILEGVNSEESRAALYSTVHGAGRVMSRTAARGKMKGSKVITPGAVTHRMMEAWVIRDKGVELRGGGTDESPHCYKRIEEVLAHHQNTVRILHTLTPIGVAMAGENEVDPYKD